MIPCDEEIIKPTGTLPGVLSEASLPAALEGHWCQRLLGRARASSDGYLRRTPGEGGRGGERGAQSKVESLPLHIPPTGNSFKLTNSLFLDENTPGGRGSVTS